MEQNKDFFNNTRLKKQEKIYLKVKANAKRNSIDGCIEINNQTYLKLSIKAIPESGKANKMIIQFLAKEWDILKDDLEITSGMSSKFKVLRIKHIVLHL